MSPRLVRPLRHLRRLAISGPCALLALYFGYHAIEGSRGLLAWIRLDAQLAQARAESEETAARKQMWAHRVALLQPRSLDLDMLDERARAVLNLADPRDVIFLETPARPNANELK